MSGTCNESDKETKILENKIKELTEENAQLKKQLSSIETQKSGKIFDKPTASRISTFSVKVAEDTTPASDATTTSTDEKNTRQTDSTKLAKASSTAPWQSYKEVLLLLQQTRNERQVDQAHISNNLLLIFL